MGLTHYAILNSLFPEAKFDFIETNTKLTYLLGKNLDVNFYHNDKNISDSYDLSLIATPPFSHCSLLENCLKRGDKKIFIEKPFGGGQNFNKKHELNNVFIGYVLRFNPIINWIKNNIEKDDLIQLEASYNSNTIENKPTGWRNGNYSGVLNEMGSHILDLTNHLFDIDNYTIQNKKVKSHISDVDDEVEFELDSKNRRFKFYFNWVNKKMRKPVFDFKLILRNGDHYSFDQQQIEINSNGKKETINITSLTPQIEYYLRGIDFTLQMKHLVNDPRLICNLNQAYLVNNIINDILRK